MSYQIDLEAMLRRWATPKPEKGIGACQVSAWAVSEIDTLRKNLAAAIAREKRQASIASWYADSNAALRKTCECPPAAGCTERCDRDECMHSRMQCVACLETFSRQDGIQ